MERCNNFRHFCYQPLLRCYSKTEDHERHVYQKHSSRNSMRQKRNGRVYDLDKGEHLVEALRAVHIGQVLDREGSAEARAEHRKIRWVDEVGNMPIQTSHF
ncbi:hypothetical protein F4677DRAFT_431275 [Hypoxylon crocopeplum]|nr:hypothetical protein F4677DRAFT_431275 [Hypoxylon crocopeplum]